VKSPLDHNLARLLTRAYEPARPRTAFTVQLLERVLEKVPEERRPVRAGNIVGSIVQGLAAAALLLLLLAGWDRLPGADAVGADRLVASGDVALRIDGGPWMAATSSTIPWLAGKIEAIVPDSAPAGALDLVALTGDRIELGPGARARLLARPEGPVLHLDAGLARLEKTLHSPSWRVIAGGAEIDWDVGRLELGPGQGHGATDVNVDRGSGMLCARDIPLRDGSRGVLVAGRWEPADETLISALAGEPGGRVTMATEPPESPDRGAMGADGARSDPDPGAARYAIRGHVRSLLDDGPIEGFRVWVRREVNLPNVTEPVCHEFEDPDGAFDIQGLDPGHYSIIVESEGHAAWRTVLAEVGAEELVLDVELGAGGVVWGYVIDSRTDTPLVGALVLGILDIPQQLIGMHEFVPEPMPFAHGFTDGNGYFELRNLSVGPHTVRASHPEYASSWTQIPGLADGEVLEIEAMGLDQGGSLAGHVERRDGRPLPGAVIVASRIDPAGRSRVIDYGVAVTGADGSYLIEHLSHDDYVVMNVADDSAPPAEWSRLQQVRISSGLTAQVDFLSDAQERRISGFLLDARSEPVAGWLLTLARESASGDFLGWAGTGTGPDGSFEFVGAEPGPHELFLGRRANDTFIRCGTLEVPTLGEREYTVRLPDTGITGRLIDSRSGAAVVGNVLLEQFDPVRSEWQFFGRDIGAPGGAFQFPFLEPGRYRMTAVDVPELANLVSEPLDVSAGAQLRVDLPLPAGGSLIVQCRDGQGRPVHGARIQLVLNGASVEHCSAVRDGGWETNSEGQLVIENLPLETLAGAVVAAGYEIVHEPVTPTAEGSLWRVALRTAGD